MHARPPADRRHRPLRVGPALPAVRVPPRPGVREHPARRRDQPRSPEGAVGAARGDGGGPGHRRRCDAAAARPVLRDRDREPDRARRHVPAAGGPARPLPRPHVARVSRARRGAADRRGPGARPPARAAPPGRVARGRRGALRGRRARLRGSAPPPLDRRARPHHARAGRAGGRRLRARQPRARPRRARRGPRRGQALRRPRGRRAALPAGPRAPLRPERRDARGRRHARRAPREDPRAVLRASTAAGALWDASA